MSDKITYVEVYLDKDRWFAKDEVQHSLFEALGRLIVHVIKTDDVPVLVRVVDFREDLGIEPKHPDEVLVKK